MALSIKDAETDSLVRRYARLRGTSYTGAIKLAVTQALRGEGEIVPEGDRAQRERAIRAAVRAVQERAAALPVLDPRDHADMLYDEDGLPK